MFFLAVGISHKTSDMTVREKFYLSPAEKELVLNRLRLEEGVSEALVMSTCNRTEIYAVMRDLDTGRLVRALCNVKKIVYSDKLSGFFYQYHQETAVRHLLSVTAGLDSLVLGEKQILGQVRQAVEVSRAADMLGRFTNILFNTALRTGKKARTETSISAGGSSVSWAAVKKAEQFWGTLSGKSVLIIGAGKMSELAADDLKRRGVGKLYIMNRTPENGEDLAQKFHGTAVSFWAIKDVLSDVDVCICSAGAPHYLIEPDLVQEAVVGRDRDLLMIDISMPRNINPGVASVAGVTLVGIDDLQQVISRCAQERLEAVYQVEKIITRKTEEFFAKLSAAKFAGKCFVS